MNAKRFLICALLVGILFLVLDILIGVLSAPIYSPYSDLPIWKTPADFQAGTIFDIINGFILVGVYATIYSGIPGSGWKKGLNYGLIVGLFRVLMTAFSSVVMYNIPLVLMITGIITGYIEIVLLCIILSFIFEKLK